MRVRICEEVTVDSEVDVDLDAVINEFFKRLEEERDDQMLRRTVGPMLGAVTTLLSKVSDQSIAALSADGREFMRERLSAQLARYQ